MGSTLGSLSYHETVALEVVMIGSSASANGYEIFRLSKGPLFFSLVVYAILSIAGSRLDFTEAHL